MDFRFTDEQRMLDDSMTRFLADTFPFDTYRAAIEDARGFDAVRWRQMAELGWLALPFPESVGGFGGSLIDIQLIARRMGERMAIDPWLTAALLPGKVLEHVGTPTAMAQLASIVSGDLLVALAALEVGAHYDVAQISTRITMAEGGHAITGRKSLVFSAPCAQRFLVTARDDNGIPVLLDVPADAAGVTVTNYRVLDGSRAAEVIFDGVLISSDAILLNGSEALTAVGRALDIASAAICADMYGAMSEAFRKSLEYARTRKQFGSAIGSLQVIQHYLVDMFIDVQQSESLVWMAGIRGDTDDTVGREQAISTAKAYLCRSAVAVTQKAIQIHGGIGVTEELDIGHFFRRVTHYSALFGDRDHHVSRFIRNQNLRAM